MNGIPTLRIPLPRKTAFVAIIFVLGAGLCHAQTVSTFLVGSGLNGPDGFALDPSENLFVANWGGGSGTTVLRITSEAVVTTFDSTLVAPDGLAFDTQGNLYVSNYNTGVINRITPERVKTVFASGFNHPSALAFDQAGNLYVTNFSGNTVSRITPGGAVSTFATGFHAPLGLVFDPDGNLYVSNYDTGVVNRVSPAGVVTAFATVPNPAGSRIQYLVRSPSGKLYLPSYGHHTIYAISPEGVVSVLAGTGVPGSTDGPAAGAQFNGPNSVALTTGGTLYVSEYNANRIRKITDLETSAVDDRPARLGLSLKSSPNPFRQGTDLSFSITRPGPVKLQVFDVLGREVAGLLDGVLPAGRHDVRWDDPAAHGVYLCRLTAGGAVETMRVLRID